MGTKILVMSGPDSDTAVYKCTSLLEGIQKFINDCYDKQDFKGISEEFKLLTELRHQIAFLYTEIFNMSEILLIDIDTMDRSSYYYNSWSYIGNEFKIFEPIFNDFEKFMLESQKEINSQNIIL